MKLRHYAGLLAAVARVEAASRLGRATVPYKVEIITTFACGSRCKTCNIWSRYLEHPEAQAREMTPPQIGRLLTTGGPNIKWVSLTGGELTDRKDCVEIVAEVLEAVGPQLSLLNLTTNGIDPARTAEVFPEIMHLTRRLKVPVYVTLSLDGLGENYEKVRGVAGGYEKVRRSMAILDDLARHEDNLTSGYQVTVSGLNAPEAEALFEAAGRDHERPIVTIANDSHTLTRGRAEVDVRHVPEAVASALRTIWRRYPKRRLNDLPPLLHLGLTQQFLESGEAPLPCVAGYGTLTVDPYGDVLQCDLRDTPLARLPDFDYDLHALCHSPEFARALAPVKHCTECWTPCQAYPTLMHHPLAGALGYARTLGARGPSSQ